MALSDLSASRLRLLSNQGYLGALLLRCPVIEDPAMTFPAAVDAKGRLYIGPRFADFAKDPGTGAYILAHEMWHILRRHIPRSAGMDHRLFNIAADMEINDDDPGGEGKRPRCQDWPHKGFCRAASGIACIWHPDVLGFPTGLTMEQYYAMLLDQHPELGGSDDGSWWLDLRPREWDSAQLPPGLSDGELRMIASQVAAAIKSGKYAGAGAGMQKWAEDELEAAKVPWQRLLRGAVATALSPHGHALQTYSRPPRRRAPANVVSPGSYRLSPNVAVVLDTSGSMGSGKDSAMRAGCSEIGGILKSVAEVRLICCDHTAAAAQNLRQAANAQLQGGGGTDMGAGIAAAVSLRPLPAVVVVVTDGYTPWPETKPALPVIVCIVRDKQNSASAPDGPDWARVIVAEVG